LMGEVIHGDYSRWANGDTLHSVTDYALHKALYSGHNDHNYFEIAHTVKRTNNMLPPSVKLYNFVDNHDVERIYTKLRSKAHFLPVHILLYTLPGVPSVYYGSEFGIEGRKERHSDDSLRPAIDLAAQDRDNPCVKLIAALGKLHGEHKNELAWGDYRELHLTNQQFAYARGSLIVAVNNADGEASFSVEAPAAEYVGLLSGKTVRAGGRLSVTLPGCGGDIFAPTGGGSVPAQAPGAEAFAKSEPTPEPVRHAMQTGAASSAGPEDVVLRSVPYEEMTVEELQAVILGKMAKNGPVTEEMRRTVMENVWQNSLVNWAKSFR
ncbi:MAG: alpha-amylase, partial [Oscillospiraceae bacterium]|nr:alpha-amylase [Oscillospiraceae bacterium]